jgi:hypothetical protein
LQNLYSLSEIEARFEKNSHPCSLGVLRSLFRQPSTVRKYDWKVLHTICGERIAREDDFAGVGKTGTLRSDFKKGYHCRFVLSTVSRAGCLGRRISYTLLVASIRVFRVNGCD